MNDSQNSFANKNLTMAYIFIALAGAVILLLELFSPAPLNDSDTPDKRSGASVITDGLTGCQYLKVSSSGGITPRLGVDGKQICKKEKS